jgi:YesN/AraC family two-component response regulator
MIVAFMSGYGDYLIAHRGLTAVTSNYLPKPFSPKRHWELFTISQ